MRTVAIPSWPALCRPSTSSPVVDTAQPWMTGPSPAMTVGAVGADTSRFPAPGINAETRLGLSMAHGLLKQSGGDLRITSELEGGNLRETLAHWLPTGALLPQFLARAARCEAVANNAAREHWSKPFWTVSPVRPLCSQQVPSPRPTASTCFSYQVLHLSDQNSTTKRLREHLDMRWQFRHSIGARISGDQKRLTRLRGFAPLKRQFWLLGFR